MLDVSRGLGEVADVRKEKVEVVAPRSKAQPADALLATGRAGHTTALARESTTIGAVSDAGTARLLSFGEGQEVTNTRS